MAVTCNKSKDALKILEHFRKKSIWPEILKVQDVVLVYNDLLFAYPVSHFLLIIIHQDLMEKGEMNKKT